MRAARRPVVVVMAKAPVMGRVKTRLARDIGPVAATRFYRTQLVRLLRVLLRDPRIRVMLAVAPNGAAMPLGRGLAAIPRLDQGHGDLGQRMARLLAGPGLGRAPVPVVLVGADIPALGADAVLMALRALGRPGVVFGPAEDGGFWGIGRAIGTRLPPRWLDGVAWSRQDTLDASMAATPGRRTVLPCILADIDTGADLVRVQGGRQ